MRADKIYIANLELIAAQSLEKVEENDHFLRSLKRYDSNELDLFVHAINKEVSDAIDCTACGNCCRTLVINVTHAEVTGLAAYLNEPEHDVKERYIEESMGGNCFINSMPCHFLKDKKCTIYDGRFTECRDFPHLHKPGFRERLGGMLNYYGMCPIIYNVVEQVKLKTGFITVEQPNG